MGTINFSSINNSFNHNLTTIDSSNTLNTNTITDDSQKYWGQNKIELNKALEISNPIKTIKIGVLDTGIDYQHEILKSLYNTTLSKSYFHTASFGILTDDSKKAMGHMLLASLQV